MSSVYRTHTCGQLRPQHVGQEARLSGWVQRKRDHGNLLFIDLRDHYGVTQVVIDASSPVFKTAEAVLQRAMEVGQIGSWTADVGPGARLYWSHEVCRIFGIDPAALTGTEDDFIARVHPEDLEKIYAARDEALASGASMRIDHRIVRPDGVVRWVHEGGDLHPGRPGQACTRDWQDLERALARVLSQSARPQG